MKRYRQLCTGRVRRQNANYAVRKGLVEEIFAYPLRQQYDRSLSGLKVLEKKPQAGIRVNQQDVRILLGEIPYQLRHVGERVQDLNSSFRFEPPFQSRPCEVRSSDDQHAYGTRLLLA